MNSKDTTEIQQIVQRIGSGADARKWDLVRNCFADHVELDYGEPVQLTPPELIARWKPLLSAFDSTEHVVFDLNVSLKGDIAKAVSKFKATHFLDGDVWILHGTYEHDLRRTPEGWKVIRMKMIPGESSGNPELLQRALTKSAAGKYARS
jgi:hypothetical protein